MTYSARRLSVAPVVGGRRSALASRRPVRLDWPPSEGTCWTWGSSSQSCRQPNPCSAFVGLRSRRSLVRLAI